MNKIYTILAFIIAMLLASCFAKRPTLDISASNITSEEGKGNYMKDSKGTEMPLPEHIEHIPDVINNNLVTSIKLGNKKYSLKDIREIQIDDNYYKSIRKHDFYKRSYKGGIDIYAKRRTTTRRSNIGGSGFDNNAAVSVNSGPERKVSYQLYYLQSDTILNGNFSRINGNPNKLKLYLKGYEPAEKIIDRAIKVHNTNKIVNWSIFGLGVAGLTSGLAGIAKGNETVAGIGASVMFASAIALPASYFFGIVKRNKLNHSAVSEYIKNDPYVMKSGEGLKTYDSLLAAKNDLGNNVVNATNAQGNFNYSMIDSVKSDFVILNDGTLIKSIPGTNMKVINGQTFVINDVKFTKDDVQYYQSRNKEYKLIDYRLIGNQNMEGKDYARMIERGKINVYSLNRNSMISNSTKKQSPYASDRSGSKMGQLYENTSLALTTNSILKLKGFFNESVKHEAEYNKIVKGIKNRLYLQYGLVALGLASAGMAIYDNIKNEDNDNYRFSKSPYLWTGVAFSVGNLVNAYLLYKKLNNLEADVSNLIRSYNSGRKVPKR